MIPAVLPLLDALRPAFKRQRSFTLVAAVLVALMHAGKYTALTELFLDLQVLVPQHVARYWSLPKLLARRRWECQVLIILMLRFLMQRIPGGILLADVTHTTTQGKRQQGRHLRPNPQYRLGNQNQSKFWAGNSALSIAYAVTSRTLSGVRTWVFGLGCLLLLPSRRSTSEPAMLRRVIAAIAPKGMLVVYDRGGNDAATINSFVRNGLRFITRLNSNAVVYADAECRQKIDLWCYQKEIQRDRRKGDHRKGDHRKVYQNTVLCYRKKVRSQLKVVTEIWYNARKHEWRMSLYVSTDCSLSAEEILGAYRTRREIEGVHADSKTVCGFNSCRLHSARSIEAYLCLSIMASGILEYLRYTIAQQRSASMAGSTLDIIQQLGMHWYHPMRLTRGLVARYFTLSVTTQREKLPTFRQYFSRQSFPDPC
jgi:hypothetical protein